MSLFQLRDWWRTKCGNGEEFDHNTMDLGNVDNDASGDTKIVVGSFQVRLVHSLFLFSLLYELVTRIGYPQS